MDCHAHVFGPFARYPLAEPRPYTPPELPAERYLTMLDRIGLSRGVLVQPVAHGTDCSALLHALKTYPTRLRGVALLTGAVTDDQLLQMSRAGVRAGRFSRPPPQYRTGAVDFAVLDALAPRLVELGWHAQIWAPCGELEAVVNRFASSGLPLVIDHMGGIDVARGVNDPDFQALLRAIGNPAMNVWIKLIPYRLSQQYPDYDDVRPFHQALVAANPERVLWGSDWPHVHLTQHMPDDGHLLDLLQDWTGDAVLCRRILVDNPTRLYGF